MDKGLKILKLILLGITIIAIPIIFIIQEEKIEREKKEQIKTHEELCISKSKIISLEDLIQSKDDLIKFYSLNQQNTSYIQPKMTPPLNNYFNKKDTISEIIFSKDIDKLIVQNGTFRNGTKITYLYDTLLISPSDVIYLKSLCKNYYLRKKN